MPKPISKHHDTQITPDPALEKRTRRSFSTEYKLRIIAEADTCQYGELGGLLRPKQRTLAVVANSLASATYP
jgi:hypothetical protein